MKKININKAKDNVTSAKFEASKETIELAKILKKSALDSGMSYAEINKALCIVDTELYYMTICNKKL